jgi:hypothetical protein
VYFGPVSQTEKFQSKRQHWATACQMSRSLKSQTKTAKGTRIWNRLRYHFVYFLNLSFIVNEMKQRDITPYNIIRKIVPARKMVVKIARVKIKIVNHPQKIVCYKLTLVQ